MQKVLLIYLACITAVAFIVTAFDKLAAIRKWRRVRERTLMLLALFGGAGGTFIAMYLCHHKTKKPLFFIGVPLLLLLWVAVMVLLYK